MHVSFSTGVNDDPEHLSFELIRANYADDFLPGVPDARSTGLPTSLYARLLDSMCGVTPSTRYGIEVSEQIVPNPYLPKAVQYGVGARPTQSFFIDHLAALRNYFEYANSVLIQYPINESRQSVFLYKQGQDNPSLTPDVVTATTAGTNLITCSDATKFIFEVDRVVEFTGASFGNIVPGVSYYVTFVDISTNTFKISESLGGPDFVLTTDSGSLAVSGSIWPHSVPFYNTANYWTNVTWWQSGYDSSTRSVLQVPQYTDLLRLTATDGMIVTVLLNGNGKAETYIYTKDAWSRIGLQDGTIQFNSSLWDYASARIGFGDNFFDADLHSEFPSEETRNIIRALNEEIYTNELLIHRNKSLILLFEFIQSETVSSRNYLPWLNKSSFIDVSHTVRELLPIPVYQNDNQDFLAGYLNEVKPYHVVIKEFLFKYTGGDTYAGDMTDFDLPAKYDSTTDSFITPMLKYDEVTADNDFLLGDDIWSRSSYSQWYTNHGISLHPLTDYQITTTAGTAAIAPSDAFFFVDNASGFPETGTVVIDGETIGYDSVDRAKNILYVSSQILFAHDVGSIVTIDLPAVIVLDGGRGYTTPPTVTAWFDVAAYPVTSAFNIANQVTGFRPAVMTAVIIAGSIVSIEVSDPGAGYPVLPEIRIEMTPISIPIIYSVYCLLPANTLTLSSNDLEFGDLVTYTKDATLMEGLIDGQQYYVGILETTPLPIVALYSTMADALSDNHRIEFIYNGDGTLTVSARASCVTESTPVRENKISIRFDRTSCNSKVTEWSAGESYVESDLVLIPSTAGIPPKVYQCIIGNSDLTFVYENWQILRSDDRQLNALDRIFGYYQPTGDMPVAMSDLVGGITYPNDVFDGNSSDDSFILSGGDFTSTPATTVQDDIFESGYGPEELVPGLISESVTMIVTTAASISPALDEMVFLINVDSFGEASVYRENTQMRTKLSSPLLGTDTDIFVEDISKITNRIEQLGELAPAPRPDGSRYIILSANKNLISQVLVYNNTALSSVNPAYLSLVIENQEPVLKIAAAATVSNGDNLTVTTIEGKFIYINGERIRFDAVDIDTNKLTMLQRGNNITCVNQEELPTNTVVYGLLPKNKLPAEYYDVAWDYPGQPPTYTLQQSAIPAAVYLRTNI